jgi:hypothetical protein
MTAKYSNFLVLRYRENTLKNSFLSLSLLDFRNGYFLQNIRFLAIPLLLIQTFAAFVQFRIIFLKGDLQFGIDDLLLV